MILNYDLPKLESELLSFQLDSKQKEVLESALNYIKSDILSLIHISEPTRP